MGFSYCRRQCPDTTFIYLEHETAGVGHSTPPSDLGKVSIERRHQQAVQRPEDELLCSCIQINFTHDVISAFTETLFFALGVFASLAGEPGASWPSPSLLMRVSFVPPTQQDAIIIINSLRLKKANSMVRHLVLG